MPVDEGAWQGITAQTRPQHTRDVLPALLCRRRQTRHRLTIPAQRQRGVTYTIDVAMPRHAQVRFDLEPSGIVRRHAQPARRGRGHHTSCPQHCARSDASAIDGDTARVDDLDAAVEQHFDPQLLQCELSPARERGIERGQDAFTGLHQHDTGAGWVKATEVFLHAMPCHLRNGARQFDAGGASADDQEIEQFTTFAGVFCGLGPFEGAKHTAAYLGGILHAL